MNPLEHFILIIIVNVANFRGIHSFSFTLKGLIDIWKLVLKEFSGLEGGHGSSGSLSFGVRHHMLWMIFGSDAGDFGDSFARGPLSARAIGAISGGRFSSDDSGSSYRRYWYGGGRGRD